MILVFSRSKELNGIGEIKRALPILSDIYVSVDSFLSLVLKIIVHGEKIEAIFSLSSADYLLALYATRLLRKNIKHISGVYHPRQWHVMLDERVSATRALVFRRVMRATPIKNVIFNAISAYESSMKILSIQGNPEICVAPGISPVCINRISSQYDGEDNCLKIITVGRFVDFKLGSILCMIDAVDSINIRASIQVKYFIYGSGPSEHVLVSKIAKLSNPNCVRLMGAISRENFAEVVANSDLFFGMGFSVVHAAMMGVPSLIAIQNEAEPYSYGYFSEFDHSIEPVFGDEMPSLSKKNISEILNEFVQMDSLERRDVGRDCKLASDVYEGHAVTAVLTTKIRNAEKRNIPYVSFREILKIRIETWISRYSAIKSEHA